MMKRLTLAWTAVTVLLAGAGIHPNTARAQEVIAASQEVLPAPQEVIPAPRQTTEGDSPLAPFIVADSAGRWFGNGRGWMSADYMFAWIRGVNTPVLVTTSPAGTGRTEAGVIGARGTQTLFGGDWLNEGMRSGFRVQGGWWLGGDSPFGAEAGFLFVNGHTSSFNADSNQFPILARPFNDALTGTQQAALVAFPGSSTGSINASVSQSSFYSANIDITEKALDEPGFRLTAMVGYRYYRLEEALNVRQSLTVTNPAFIPGTLVTTSDSFNTRNDFHGFDMGFRSQCAWNNLTLEVLTKLAVGDVRRQVTIAGNQITGVPGAAPVVDPAGVFALSTNSGTFVSHDWKVMPEAGVTLGWQLRPNLNLRVGYSFLFLNGVARAVDQVDTTLNPNLFPPSVGGTPHRPAFGLIRSDVWIQSLNIGVLWTF